MRAPVAITELANNLYATLAALRGYLLTGDAQAKRERSLISAGVKSLAEQTAGCVV